MYQNSVYLSIGSNVGNKIENIKKTLISLTSKKTKVIKVSSFYESEPLYFKNQSNFINIVLEVVTNLKMVDLLKFTQGIEIEIGRDLSLLRNRPRIIDIDILTYNNERYSTSKLTIPHKRILDRLFVLLPWSEIAPDFILANSEKNIKSLLNSTKDDSKVIKLN